MSRKSDIFKAITGKNYNDTNFSSLSSKETKKQNTSGLIKNAKGNFLDQLLGTTGDILADVGEGILGFGEGIADTLTYLGSDVVGIFNKDAAEAMRENARANSTEIIFGKDKEKNVFGNWRNDLDEYSRSGDFGDMVFKGIGTTAGAVGTAGLGAGAGVWTQTSQAATFIPMFTSSYGNAKSEALNNGADNFNATVSALKSGTIDGFTELMFGALPGLNKGSKLGNTITDAIGKGAEKALGKTAGRIAVGLTKTMGEGAEEVFGNIFNAQANDILHFITNGSYNYGMENQTGNILKDTINVLSDAETWKEFLSASLSAAITQSGTKIFTKAQTNKVIKEYAKDHNIGFNEAKEKLENYSNIFEDITNKKLGYTEALENREESKAKALNLMKSQYLNNIEEQINQTTNKAINSLNERIEQAKAELKQIDEEGVLDANDPEVQKMVLSKYNLNSLDSLSEKEIKQYKDSLREKYVDRLENPDKYKKYEYELTDNERTNKVYQSADKANIDNTKESRDFVAKMARVANDLKTDVLFTNNEELKANPNIDLEAIAQDLIQEEQTKKGSELTEKEIEEIKNRVLSEIGGYYNSKTGTIYINADNKTEGSKFIFGHELMHRLEQNKVQEELRKAIFDHAKTKGIYDTERATLEKLYKGVTKDIDSELVANLLGKLYQDENFVKDLAVKKPNVFTQIFSKLKEMYYKATGQQEKAELEKIVRLYQKVYNEVKEEGFKGKKGTKLSIVGYTGERNYIESQRKEALQKATSEDEIVKINEKYDNELEKLDNIREETLKTISRKTDYTQEELEKTEGWFMDIVEDFKKEISDESYRIIDSKFQRLKNGETIKLGDLITHDYLLKMYPELKNVDVEVKNINGNGSYRNDMQKITINPSRLKNRVGFKQTLLHEIQHAIQYSEGFIPGNTTKLKTKLGDISIKWLYYNTLGEIEATNTANRMLMAEEERKEKLPESAKLKPTHEKIGNMTLLENALYNLVRNGKINVAANKLNRRLRNEIFKNTNKTDISNSDITYNSNTDISSSNTGKEGEVEDTSFSNDIKYSLSKDNEGRELTKQQQEYFKDSKARDSQGRLITLYHGTQDYDFNEFMGGTFLTDDYMNADGYAYGERVIEAYANIKNPLVIECNGAKWDKLDTPYGTSTREIASGLDESKYDGIIFKNINDNWIDDEEAGYPGDVYYVPNSNQIKEVDNENPTTNPDIRYSLTVQEANTGVDNNGKELSQQQKEFFKDSKVTDEYGNLLEVYHGTTGGDFTIFDKSYGNVEGDFGKGFYFSSDLGDVEQNYEDGGADFDNKVSRLAERIEQEEEISYEEAKEKAQKQLYKGGNLFTAYLNIENPAIVGQTRLFSYDDYIDDIESDLQDEAESYQDEINEYAQEYDLSYEEARDDYLREQGIYDEIVNRYLEDDIENAVSAVENELESYGDEIQTLRNILWESVYDGGTEIEELKKKLNELEFSNENGDLANNEAVRLIIEAAGYDGIIDNTVSKKFTNMGLGSDTTHYIVFNSNQIKNIDNTNPTDDPDIRYSMGNNPGTITPNDMVVKELYGELPLPTAKQVDLPYADTEKPKEETTEDKRLQNKINKENEKAIKIATKDMELNRQELKQLRQDLEKYKGKTREELTNAETFNDIYDIVSNYANRNYIQTDEELKAVQNEIRKTKIRVPEELKKQITDYNYFRKQNMGRLMLSNSGQSIDSVYEELSNSYPGYFKDATTEADMLYELADFMNKDVNTIMEYQLTDTELNNQATKIFNKLVTNTLNENDINEIQEKLSKKKISRKDVRNILLDEMGITAEDLQEGKDINPINYTRTDPVRVNEKVFGNEIGNKINDATINVTKHNEAERTRFLNQERDEIKDLGIKARSKESAAVQKYGEKYYINEQGEKVPYGDRELASEFKDAKTQEKIKKAAEVIRSKYDRYIDSVNKVLDEMGYNIIPKRNDYMHHFQELTDIFSKWGTPFNPQSMSDDLLPTDINGLTEFNKPGKNWFSAAQQRMGEKTTYDAITGIDQYLEGVSNLIYHTGDIQRYRALEELVRNTYGQEHGLENAEGLTEEEFNQRVADIQANKLSGYASWLNEQANTLANKKSTIDRGFEKTFGRKVYNAMNTLKTQVGSNMTGFNVRSALTNFISTTLAASKTNKLAMVKGTVQTINNIFHKDNFVDKSDFLTARFGSDVLSKKGWQKLANAGQMFMSGTDWFTSNVIVRSKYYEGLAKGMTEEQAIKYADDFGFRVMGDRSKGSTANAFNSKTLGLLTQFQLEVNNQWDFMLHDSKRDYNLAEDKSKATAGILFQMGQLAAYSYLANELFDKFTGSRVTFDPIEIFKKLFGLDDDDKDKSVEERMTEASQLLIDGLPFVSTFTGGRIPLSSALPNMEELITGKDKNGNEKSRLDTLKEPLPYLFMPTGYSQLNKTKGALEMYDSSLPVAGSYTDSGNLRFTTKTDAASTARNLLFGKWSSEEAQDYLDSGYKTIPKSKIQEMIDLNMDSTEYRAYRENLTKATKTTNDEGYTKYIDNNNNTYWYDKETGNLYDDNGKLSDKNVMSLNKANKSQATADYINSLPYTKEQKNIMLNNALGKSDTITDQYGYEKYKDSNGNVYWLDSKNDILYDKNYNEVNDNRLKNEKFINGLQKVSNEVNISDYNKYGDYEEYQYAISNPERYSAISQITDYKTYQNYADEIESIKSKYQTTDNMTTKQKQYISKQRKQAVFDYINNLNLSKAKKLMLYRLAGGYSINNYKTQMFNYIDSLKLSKKEKETIYKELF